MGIPLPQGRQFTALDSVEAPWVVIVNGAMAEPYWPNEAPTGTAADRGTRKRVVDSA